MKEKLIYASIVLASYLLLGSLIQDTGSAMVILLMLIPAMVILVSFIYGIKQGFDYMIPIIAMLTFIPIVYALFNESALIYVFVYGLLALLSNFVGGLFGRRIHHGK